MAEANLLARNDRATTPITFLQTLYDHTNADHDKIDEARVSDDHQTSALRVRNSWFDDGMTELYCQAHHLQHAILRELPITWQDAFILAAHFSNIGGDIANVTDEYRSGEHEALRTGLENLLVFLADETDCDLAGYMNGTLQFAQRAVYVRTGRPEKWALNEEAEAA